MPWELGIEDPRDASTDGGESLIATVTALAPAAAQGEVAAKVALLRGYPAALRQVEAGWRGSGGAHSAVSAEDSVALLLDMGNGRVVCSENLQGYLESLGGGGDIWWD